MKRIINFRGLKALGISGPVKLAADIVFKFT